MPAQASLTATGSFNFVDPAFASCDPIRQTMR
jgi:hypothetical protein